MKTDGMLWQWKLNPKKMKMKMYEGYVIDGRKIIGMINHSHSFCYMEDTSLEYLALWKTLSEGEWVEEKDTGTDILALPSPILQE